jgi:ubiquinone/menaquinone biosynthesis C-methylase UbiE
MSTGSSKQLDAILASYPDPDYRRRAALILSHLEVAPRIKILDVGCGMGKYESILTRLYTQLEVVGVDIDMRRLRQAKGVTSRSQVQFVHADATCLPFRGSCFDRVIASEILEHLESDLKALLEIARVLSDGCAMLSVPNASFPMSWDPINYVLERVAKTHVPSRLKLVGGIWAGHRRLYTEQQLRSRMAIAGLRVLEVWRSTRVCLPFVSFLTQFAAAAIDRISAVELVSWRQSGIRRKGRLIRLLKSPIDFVDKLNSDQEPGEISVTLIAKADLKPNNCQPLRSQVVSRPEGDSRCS